MTDEEFNRAYDLMKIAIDQSRHLTMEEIREVIMLLLKDYVARGSR